MAESFFTHRRPATRAEGQDYGGENSDENVEPGEERREYEYFSVPERQRALKARIEEQRLPMAEKMPDVARALTAAAETDGVLLLEGETGVGKSIYGPVAMMNALRDLKRPEKIIVMQPRKDAARQSSENVAAVMGVPFGKDVGYSTAEANMVKPFSKISVVTPGIFLRYLKSGYINPREIGGIIIDEVHQASLDYDLVLGIAKELRAKNELPLALMMSATMDKEQTGQFFGVGKERFFSIEGRKHRITEHFADPEAQAEFDPARPEYGRNYLDRTVNLVSQVVHDTKEGDTLVFVPGPSEIRYVTNRLKHVSDFEILGLHGQMSPAERAYALGLSSTRHDRRSIVVATNVAETSITRPGIRHVVDTLRERSARFDSHDGMVHKGTTFISRMQAKQRAGRSGRTAEGAYYCIEPKEVYDRLPEFPEPEILHANLAHPILKIRAMGRDPKSFYFRHPPEQGSIARGEQELRLLGAIDEADRTTARGVEMMKLDHFEPHTALLVLEGERHKCLEEALALAAFMREDRLFVGPSDADIAVAPGRDKKEKIEAARKQVAKAQECFKVGNSDYFKLLKLFKVALENGLAEALRTDRSPSGMYARRSFENWCRQRYVKCEAMLHAAARLQDFMKYAPDALKAAETKIAAGEREKLDFDWEAMRKRLDDVFPDDKAGYNDEDEEEPRDVGGITRFENKKPKTPGEEKLENLTRALLASHADRLAYRGADSYGRGRVARYVRVGGAEHKSILISSSSEGAGSPPELFISDTPEDAQGREDDREAPRAYVRMIHPVPRELIAEMVPHLTEERQGAHGGNTEPHLSWETGTVVEEVPVFLKRSAIRVGERKRELPQEKAREVLARTFAAGEGAFIADKKPALRFIRDNYQAIKEVQPFVELSGGVVEVPDLEEWYRKKLAELGIEDLAGVEKHSRDLVVPKDEICSEEQLDMVREYCPTEVPLKGEVCRVDYYLDAQGGYRAVINLPSQEFLFKLRKADLPKLGLPEKQATVQVSCDVYQKRSPFRSYYESSLTREAGELEKMQERLFASEREQMWLTWTKPAPEMLGNLRDFVAPDSIDKLPHRAQEFGIDFKDRPLLAYPGVNMIYLEGTTKVVSAYYSTREQAERSLADMHQRQEDLARQEKQRKEAEERSAEAVAAMRRVGTMLERLSDEKNYKLRREYGFLGDPSNTLIRDFRLAKDYVFKNSTLLYDFNSEQLATAPNPQSALAILERIEDALEYRKKKMAEVYQEIEPFKVRCVDIERMLESSAFGKAVYERADFYDRLKALRDTIETGRTHGSIVEPALFKDDVSRLETEVRVAHKRLTSGLSFGQKKEGVPERGAQAISKADLRPRSEEFMTRDREQRKYEESFETREAMVADIKGFKKALREQIDFMINIINAIPETAVAGKAETEKSKAERSARLSTKKAETKRIFVEAGTKIQQADIQMGWQRPAYEKQLVDLLSRVKNLARSREVGELGLAATDTWVDTAVKAWNELPEMIAQDEAVKAFVPEYRRPDLEKNIRERMRRLLPDLARGTPLNIAQIIEEEANQFVS